ncbi:hypothetical protein [Photobacterium leiognathi]|nr:hypothetical protein [Photobacterium leiognathi]
MSLVIESSAFPFRQHIDKSCEKERLNRWYFGSPTDLWLTKKF